ncbi:MAG: hypothetical protein CTY12_08100 [Methylotenera sp.]|nr:MAG: hypothetical protein CTY12_08100 [Methylotenera sp.]
MAKTTKQSSKKLNKEDLFNIYFQVAHEALQTFEHVFELDGVISQVFGEGSEAEMQNRVRNSIAWYRLSALYNYAMDGIASEHPVDIVIGAAEVIRLLDTEMGPSLNEFEEICAMGDGRAALDEGSDISLNKLALLADVDPRTIRNAASSNELNAKKTEDGLFIDNASARSWLQGRRGFKPTVSVTGSQISLDQITTPGEFSLFLKSRRDDIEIDAKLLELYPLEAANIGSIEQGIFALPINSAFPLADIYQLDRKAFLACVMRVFFSEQLSTLRDCFQG